VLILSDFKSFEPEVLILMDFKSLFPEVLILVELKSLRMREIRKYEVFVEVLILDELQAKLTRIGQVRADGSGDLRSRFTWSYNMKCTY
jgi:hypothetical protein